ncbi:F-box protein PP2-B10 [Triticum urartu]|uniref:F-box protein PP2-B10 n=1 Tax=Triticum urartu TaxID=4572 RepID=M7YW63_TRIUA|nr:F-box protein PP2-B10 [Triticum urartu]
MERLPAELVSAAFAGTTPRDAGRAAMVSTAFRAAADSDIVWARFLPPLELLAPEPQSKKDMFLRLLDGPVLLRDRLMGDLRQMLHAVGEESVHRVGPHAAALELDPSLGLHVRARSSHLPIVFRYLMPLLLQPTISIYDNPSYVCHRFSEGAQLNSVTWLEIRGSIHTDMLTPDSKYGAYLVFKRTQNFSGFNYPIQKATLYFGQIMEYTSPVLLGENWTPPPELGVAQPQRRADGWMEISLGHFHTSGNELYAEMSFSLMETEGEVTQKRGLIVHGIEIRREKSG